MRGEMCMRGWFWYPGRREASRPEVSRRPEVKEGTPEIGEREECRGEMPKKRNITSKL